VQRFYRVVYRIEKGDDTASLVERAANAVAASGSPDHPISFLFTDPLLRTQRSALDYLIKAYPVFEAYRTSSAQFPMPGAAMISDVPVEGVNAERTAVPAATVVDVARGIPRRFPFGFATFTWRGVAALDLAPNLPAADYTAGGMHGRLAGRFGMPLIAVSSSWGATKRTLGLTAVVRLAEDDAGTRKPSLPDVTRALLEALGRRKTDDTYALPPAGAAATHVKDTSLAMSEALAKARQNWRDASASFHWNRCKRPHAAVRSPRTPDRYATRSRKFLARSDIHRCRKPAAPAYSYFRNQRLTATSCASSSIAARGRIISRPAWRFAPKSGFAP
jgi:hypothetical protein